MANAHYNPFKQALLGSESHDLDADDIRAILVDSADYTFSAAHDFLDDIAAGARVAVSAALTGKSVTNGTFDSSDFSWPTVTGDQSEAVVLYNHDGNGAGADAARQLMTFYDTGMTGMPVTPSGGNINFVVHASGWFAL
jgi:hypothetical protein